MNNLNKKVENVVSAVSLAKWLARAVFTLMSCVVFHIFSDVHNATPKAKFSAVTADPNCNSLRKTVRQAVNGFTLVELLIVIAIIGVLAAMFLSALAKSKQRATQAACLNNVRQFTFAWVMYSDDNADLLVNLSTYNTSFTPVIAPEGVPWRTDMFHGLNEGELSPVPALPGGVAANTDAAQKYLTEMGFQQPRDGVAGPLFQYCKNPDSMHCPGDKRYQLAVGQNPPYSGPYSWDSYSGATYLNGEHRNDGTGNNISKRTAITRPSDKFIWTEGADMRGENVGSWTMSDYGSAADAGGPFSNAILGDSPADFHVASSVFNFCDGHAESHKWQDGTTVAYANDTTPGKDAGGATQTAAQHPGNVDAIWIAAHYPGNQNP